MSAVDVPKHAKVGAISLGNGDVHSKFTKIMDSYKIGEMEPDGKARNVFAVAKQLDALITDAKEREIWEKGIVQLASDDMYRDPDNRFKSWNQLIKVMSLIFKENHPGYEKHFEIYNGVHSKPIAVSVTKWHSFGRCCVSLGCLHFS